jgi:hypothetical protein
MVFIIYENDVPVTEDVKIKVTEDESTAYQFINPGEARSLLSDYYDDFWAKNYL